MKNRIRTRKQIITLGFITLLLLAAAGCSMTSTVSSSKSTTPAPEASSTTPPLQIGSTKFKSLDEKHAAQAALDSAQEANTGSDFKVDKILLVDGWARVDIEETGVPRDEAIGYSVYVKKNEKGSWDYVTSGTDVTPDDVPGAPNDLFVP